MGFHINPQNLTLKGTTVDREKPEMKFYINAGTDTYKVARIFQEKCKANNLNYYFKVVDARKMTEYYRTDKMCIYTEFKDAEKFLDIIREIKIENPDIKFENPPILSGRIDNFIGVGTDGVAGGKSYNHRMSKICFDAMEKVFKGIEREAVMEHIKLYPEKLQDLENEITSKAKEIGLSEEKICVEKDFQEKINRYKKSEEDKKKDPVVNNKPDDTTKKQKETSKEDKDVAKKTSNDKILQKNQRANQDSVIDEKKEKKTSLEDVKLEKNQLDQKEDEGVAKKTSSDKILQKAQRANQDSIINEKKDQKSSLEDVKLKKNQLDQKEDEGVAKKTSSDKTLQKAQRANQDSIINEKKDQKSSLEDVKLGKNQLGQKEDESVSEKTSNDKILQKGQGNNQDSVKDENKEQKSSLLKRVADWFKLKFGKEQKRLTDGSNKEVASENNVSNNEIIKNNEKETENNKDSNEDKVSKNNDSDNEKENINTTNKGENLLFNEVKEKENELKSCIKAMAEDYINKDYKAYADKMEQYEALIRNICDLKIKESGKNLTPVERMLEYRKIDFIGSAILDSSKRVAEKEKYYNKKASEIDIESIKSSIDSLDKYCLSEIKPINATEKFNSTNIDMKIDKSSLNKSAKNEVFRSNPYSDKHEDR